MNLNQLLGLSGLQWRLKWCLWLFSKATFRPPFRGLLIQLRPQKTSYETEETYSITMTTRNSSLSQLVHSFFLAMENYCYLNFSKKMFSIYVVYLQNKTKPSSNCWVGQANEHSCEVLESVSPNIRHLCKLQNGHDKK